MSNQDYFAKDFDPSKVTIKRLKEILSAHNIPYKDNLRKAEFVQKFREHILPIVELQKPFERREAVAYCHRPRPSKRHIDRRPPAEFIKRKQRIRLSSGIIIVIIISIFGFLYLSL